MICFIISLLGVNPSESLFSYSQNLNHDEVYFNYPLPNFSSPSPSCASISSDIKTITFNSGCKDTYIATYKFKVTTTPGYYTNFQLNCPGSGDSESSCWIHMYEPRHGGPLYFYGASAQISNFSRFQLANPINENDIKLELHLSAKNGATFQLPTIRFYYDPFTSFSTIEKKALSGHTDKVTKVSVNVQKSLGKVIIQTLGLINPHPFPRKMAHWSEMSYENAFSTFYMLPIIANGTHIVAFDIKSTDFLYMWNLFNGWYDTTIIQSLRMPLQIRPEYSKDSVTFSYYIMKATSTSFEDALEQFHIEFDEIYGIQPYGAGAMIGHQDLNKCFPSNTDDRDIFMANIQWNTWPDNTKYYLPDFYFLEPHLKHIPIVFETDENKNWDKLNNNCVCDNNNPSGYNNKTLKDGCKMIIESHGYQRTGKRNIIYEDASWNRNGQRANLLYESNSFTSNFFFSDIERLRNNGPNRPLPTGIHFDYYSVDTVSFYFEANENSHRLKNVFPYVLLEDRFKYEPFIPYVAGHFENFKTYLVNSTNGYSLNTVWVLPQWTQYVAQAGGEITFVSDDGKADETYYTRMENWKLRYNLGSRPLTRMEMTNVKQIKNNLDDILSLHLDYGSVPSFYNDLASSNLLTNCDLVSQVKDTFQRWQKPMMSVLNNTVLYVNNKGMISVDFPSDQNNPAYNDVDERSHDVSDVTTWCDRDNRHRCHTVVFLGWANSIDKGWEKETDSSFVRTAVLTFDPSVKVIKKSFAATKEIKVYINDKKVTVKMSGVANYHAFRAAVLDWSDVEGVYEIGEDDDDDENSNENNESSSNNNGKKTNVGLIVGLVITFVIIIAAVVVIIIIFLRKKSLESETTVNF